MESVIVYTGRDLRRMREEGGCGHWTASPIRVEAAEYLVCVRNRREQWASPDFEHGTAFLIAKIKGTKPSAMAARITVEFDAYAMCDVPDAWQLLAYRQRFPVAYLETAEVFRRLQLDPGSLTWKKLEEEPSISPGQDAPTPGGLLATFPAGRNARFEDVIAAAKRDLAASLGIAAERISLTIHA